MKLRKVWKCEEHDCLVPNWPGKVPLQCAAFVDLDTKMRLMRDGGSHLRAKDVKPCRWVTIPENGETP